MRQLQEPDDQTTAGELDPNLRRHLETQLAELNARYDMLAKRIAAVDADFVETVMGMAYKSLSCENAKRRWYRSAIALWLCWTQVLSMVPNPLKFTICAFRSFAPEQSCFRRRIAALSADEERAAKVSWLDREGELAVRRGPTGWRSNSRLPPGSPR